MGTSDNSNVIQLTGRVRRLRGIASIATALAAALIGMLAVQTYRPELLPDGLRPKPRIETVEVRTPAPAPVPSAQYVALLQRDAGSPAFILTVDAATKNFTVRKVGADAEPGKSFELWLISDRLPPDQRCDLRRDGRADRRIADRSADLGADLYRQADRDRAGALIRVVTACGRSHKCDLANSM
jgi:hypothetical protein